MYPTTLIWKSECSNVAKDFELETHFIVGNSTFCTALRTLCKVLLLYSAVLTDRYFSMSYILGLSETCVFIETVTDAVELVIVDGTLLSSFNMGGTWMLVCCTCSIGNVSFDLCQQQHYRYQKTYSLYFYQKYESSPSPILLLDPWYTKLVSFENQRKEDIHTFVKIYFLQDSFVNGLTQNQI
jgi:hypothetical protein